MLTCIDVWYHGAMALNFRPATAEVAEELRRIAFMTRRSANAILNEALRDWLDTKGRAAVAAYRAEQAKGQRR
jgi:predicted transcriptional regulator